MELSYATVDSFGIKLSYYDSGALETPYTTLVCLHGLGYHASTFSRLLPPSKEKNYRIIALNRRGYAGSTPFSDEELAPLKEKDETLHEEYLYKRGLEIAQFLSFLVKTERLYPKKTGQDIGGIILTGWSLGNSTAFAFLAYLDKYPKEVIQTIEPYLKSFFSYGTPLAVFGFPRPEEAYNPFRDQNLPASEQHTIFKKYVTTYYSHPLYDSSGKEISERSLLSLEQSPSDTAKLSSIANLSEEELSSYLDQEAFPKFEALSLSISPETLQKITRRALSAETLPKLEIYILYGQADLWEVQWTTWEFQKLVEKWKQDGKSIREVVYSPAVGAAHFMHWDEPSSFLDHISVWNNQQKVRKKSGRQGKMHCMKRSLVYKVKI
ncbi:alpha beta-hydrolase [Pyrrhoderma noxium]|uniref:Alpha beta-hydrolase n=1 Tax=Pyrrhoderma noxium TaxID=2282107 RepID=A0A286UJ27_9AGAM|nr:alpha beta-hydrolase [Pyrrhoderma noxium]